MSACYCCGHEMRRSGRREHFEACPYHPSRAHEWPKLFPGRAPESNPAPETKPAAQFPKVMLPSGSAKGREAFEAEMKKRFCPDHYRWDLLDPATQAAWAIEAGEGDF